MNKEINYSVMNMEEFMSRKRTNDLYLQSNDSKQNYVNWR